MDYYKQIFKRKSFHIFKNTDVLTDIEIRGIEDFIKTVKPLNAEIKTEICIVPEKETTCKRGGEYCILFYSELKGEYLRNIGYIGQQIDLYLASQNIGALWFGIGKPKSMELNGLGYVIMISIAKMPEDKFRKDMFKAKRKPLEEIWSGDTLGVAEIVRFTPSACNTQPWVVENAGNDLSVYRYKKPGKRGIMPADKVRYYNKIDMGIFLFMLETCLEHEGFNCQRILFEDMTDDSVEKTLIAKYTYQKDTGNKKTVDNL
ncbi:MAG: nitroreductase [Ruminococcaceae bacterium]|nr:nitroreductase [Oscillospiraceae bacterium]